MSDADLRLRFPARPTVVIGDPEYSYRASRPCDDETKVDDSELVLSVASPLCGDTIVRLARK